MPDIKHIRDSLSNRIVNQDDIALASSTTSWNLGVIFDQDLFLTHVKMISRTASFHVHNIAKILYILSQQDAEKVVHASILGYYNSLFLGCP